MKRCILKIFHFTGSAFIIGRKEHTALYLYIFANCCVHFAFPLRKSIQKKLRCWKTRADKLSYSENWKIIIENRDLIIYLILHNISSEYTATLKYADIALIFKNDDKTDRTNYNFISILPNLRKIYGRLMQGRAYLHLNLIFVHPCGLRDRFGLILNIA